MDPRKYPFPTTVNGFHLLNRETTDYHGPPPVHDRNPVLAIGSNASPEQLVRRGLDDVYATSFALKDHVVVYAARVSRQGYVPATLAKSPGTTVFLKMLWLTPAQEWFLDKYERPEPNNLGYQKLTLTKEYTPDLPPVSYYDVAAGPLLIEGEPSALVGTTAMDTVFKRRTQLQVMELVSQQMGLSGPDGLIRDAANPGRWENLNLQLAG